MTSIDSKFGIDSTRSSNLLVLLSERPTHHFRTPFNEKVMLHNKNPAIKLPAIPKSNPDSKFSSESTPERLGVATFYLVSDCN